MSWRNLRRESREAGFTLVEVIVALSAGLLVSAAAYTLALNAMKSFQDESRIATSQVAVSIALSRLQGDVQRAGYMASPNIALDPNRCSTVNPASAPILAVQVAPGGSALPATFGYAAVANPNIEQPDMLIVTGNMSSSEQFEYRSIDDTGRVYLSMNRGPVVRLLAELGMNEDAVEAVFVPTQAGAVVGSRFARVVSATGKHSYVVVTNAEANLGVPGSESITLTVEGPGGATLSSLSNLECGFVNRGTGLINPVSVIRYRIGQLPVTSPYVAALAPTGDDRVTGESVRAELLREELTPAAAVAAARWNPNLILDTAALVNNAQLSSQEIVSEFAVDFDLSAVYAFSPADLRLVPFGNAAAPGLDDVEPQDFRSLRVRVATRARFPDRDETGPDDVVTRFLIPALDTSGTRLKYARVRTLTSEIQLPNLAGVTW